MSDYISRQAAIEAVDECTKLKITDDFYTVYTEEMKDVIADIPAADVVEVVRCKDCKHGRDAVSGNYKHKLNLIHCNRIDDAHPYIMRSNDFCSRGERAEGRSMSRYIDADKLMEEFDRCVKEYGSEDFHIDLIADIVNDEPDADVRENIKGEWHDYQEGKWIYQRCSVCGYDYAPRKYPFCPNCGADMRADMRGEA